MEENILLPKSTFLQEFILDKLGRQLQAPFQMLSPISYRSTIEEQSNPKPHFSGVYVILTDLTLSEKAPEITISGGIQVDTTFEEKVIWESSWHASQYTSFHAKIQIEPFNNGQELILFFSGFSFDRHAVNHSENAGAKVSDAFSVGQFNRIIDDKFNDLSSAMQHNFGLSFPSENTNVIPNKLLNLKNLKYQLKPLHFNDLGDLVVNVDYQN